MALGHRGVMVTPLIVTDVKRFTCPQPRVNDGNVAALRRLWMLSDDDGQRGRPPRAARCTRLGGAAPTREGFPRPHRHGHGRRPCGVVMAWP
jgi:hypothetical protein